MNEQINFWVNTYGEDYIKKNSIFDKKLAAEAWLKMVQQAGQLNSILECGSNIGRNIDTLNQILPNASKSIIEVSPRAYSEVTKKYKLKFAINSSILEAEIAEKFDLVFTMGVLTHIHPKDLLDNMNKMYNYSNKYILIGEYFNRTPVTIPYHGEEDRLFKSDFGKLFIENFDVTLVDYGFLWGHIYDSAGFDDLTWWLFKKRFK